MSPIDAFRTWILAQMAPKPNPTWTDSGAYQRLLDTLYAHPEYVNNVRLPGRRQVGTVQTYIKNPKMARYFGNKALNTSVSLSDTLETLWRSAKSSPEKTPAALYSPQTGIVLYPQVLAQATMDPMEILTHEIGHAHQQNTWPSSMWMNTLRDRSSIEANADTTARRLRPYLDVNEPRFRYPYGAK